MIGFRDSGRTVPEGEHGRIIVTVRDREGRAVRISDAATLHAVVSLRPSMRDSFEVFGARLVGDVLDLGIYDLFGSTARNRRPRR